MSRCAVVGLGVIACGVKGGKLEPQDAKAIVETQSLLKRIARIRSDDFLTDEEKNAAIQQAARDYNSEIDTCVDA